MMMKKMGSLLVALVFTFVMMPIGTVGADVGSNEKAIDDLAKQLNDIREQSAAENAALKDQIGSLQDQLASQGKEIEAKDAQIAKLSDRLESGLKDVEVQVAAAPGGGAVLSEGASWAEKIKFMGDIRLRNEIAKNAITTDNSRTHRNRLRARLGMEAQVLDNVKAGITIATGDDSDARSTNQSLDNAFSSKDLWLDKAYVQWDPYEEVKVIGGKFDNPLYVPGDLLWDDDLRFEGAAVNLDYGIDVVQFMVNAGIFQIDDVAIDKKNPYLYAVQLGAALPIEDLMDIKGFTTYYDFSKMKNGLSAAAGTATDGLYDYNVFEASGEVTLHVLEDNAPEALAKPLTFFADWANNIEMATESKRGAWQVGTQLGRIPQAKGDWRVQYSLRELQRNVFPDVFPDQDFARGRSDAYGQELIFSYGLSKNIYVEFDYYRFRDKGLTDETGHILQSDLNVKF